MALTPVTEARGTAVPIMANDIDTDRIIPARYLKAVTFETMGEGLFYDERFDADGRSKGHPLDDPHRAGAAIIVTGDNFGCGSSREHAPQSIMRAGFKGMIAGSFAEIFFGNCTTLGLVCAVVDEAGRNEIAALVERDPSAEVVIDVTAQEVRAGGKTYRASIRDTAREALLTGYWDPIGELLEGVEQVKALAAARGYPVSVGEAR
ncbi:MAG TPA: 3-isopropylmalate dehydratase small subunit [Trueperaceae bacterium]|nr:3-isopropylmalate dehydratase small subunit [Trueperaceae bacterium]